AALRARLLDVGFDRRATPGATDCFVHPGAMFPTVILDAAKLTRVFVKVESVIDFLSAWHIADDPGTAADDIEGEPLSPRRRARVFCGESKPAPAELWVVERHGYRGVIVPKPDPDRGQLMLRHGEAFRRRRRDFDDDAQGFDHADRLIDSAIAD